jgi:hypothetical protein
MVPMRVRLTQFDGKLPNIALMKIAQHHRKRGVKSCSRKMPAGLKLFQEGNRAPRSE